MSSKNSENIDPFDQFLSGVGSGYSNLGHFCLHFYLRDFQKVSLDSPKAYLDFIKFLSGSGSGAEQDFPGSMLALRLIADPSGAASFLTTVHKLSMSKA